MWLKPGKKYLFGRVKKDGVRFAIDHKTVSRKHFVITVDPVRDQDVGQVHARTKIIITDEKSKAGTNIDGELIRGSSQELKNPVNSIRPGSCPHELLIRWQPCVMTFMLSKKEIKNGDLKTRQDRVKDLDIRAVADYLTEHTTHLVATKRNTAKGLQALIEGRPIVTDAYIDALIYASTPIDLQEEENLCPLETDFDDAWPDPTPHLPPPGKEPTDKPAEAYKPDSARAKVFDKYTCIFFDQTQYDTLLPPITTGHGKALLLKVDAGSTTIEDGENFVRKASNNIGRTIIVNVNENDESKSWLADYIDQLCAKFDQEPASQSDFLDAVLAVNAAQLRKSRRPTTSTSSDQDHRNHVNGSKVANGTLTNGHSSAHKSNGTQAEGSQSPALSSRAGSALPESAAKRGSNNVTQQPQSQDDNPRPTKRPRFVPPKKPRAAFDDDFNPDAIAEYDEEAPPAKSQPRNRRSSPVAVKEEPVQHLTSSRDASPALSVQADSEDDEMDELLPAAAAMTRANGLPTRSSLKSKPTARTKEVKLMDVREVVRAQREAEQEQQRKEQEEMKGLHEEAELTNGPANLVKVSTFDLPMRRRSGKDGTNEFKGESWRPEWDGRKNFKGFVRARDVAAGNGEAPRRREKIIIPLEPAKRHDYGLGDKYWEKTQEEKDKAAKEKERRKRASQKSQSQAQGSKRTTSQSQQSETVHEESDSEMEQPESGADEDRNGGEEHTNAETARLQAEAEGVLDHPIDVDEPRQTRGSETQTSVGTKSTATTRSGKVGSKRPASKTPPSSSKTTASKRQKTLPVTVVHGSDSDDGDDSDDLKFKVGRGRKARTARR